MLGLAGLATASILTSTVPGQYLILARPGTATGAILDMVYRARGGIVGFGGLPGIALAASDDPGFAEAVRAEGAWIGSAFLASEEANIHAHQKQAIVDATEEGTVISRSITGKPARIIRSAWTDFWEHSEHDPLPMPFQSAVAGSVLVSADADQRQDINPGFAGQGIGMIRSVRRRLGGEAIVRAVGVRTWPRETRAGPGGTVKVPGIPGLARSKN